MAAALPSAIEAAKAAAAEEAARVTAAAELESELSDESDSDEDDVNDEVLMEALGFARYAASTRNLVCTNGCDGEPPFGRRTCMPPINLNLRGAHFILARHLCPIEHPSCCGDIART